MNDIRVQVGPRLLALRVVLPLWLPLWLALAVALHCQLPVVFQWHTFQIDSGNLRPRASVSPDHWNIALKHSSIIYTLGVEGRYTRFIVESISDEAADMPTFTAACC